MEKTRGICNKNPFNIKISENSWLGKIAISKNSDKVFEQFYQMDYGLRAGMQLLRGYIARGYDTPEKILNRFAPRTENKTDSYLAYVLDSPLHADDNLSVNSLNFYWLCQKICMFESKYDFTYDHYESIRQRFRLW